MGKRGAIRELWLPDLQRFCQQVNYDGPAQPHMSTCCWIWTGGTGSHGYGVITPTTKPERQRFAVLMAHRVSWTLNVAPVPTEALVLHHCDIRLCVRPSHLFIGDDKANSDDKMEKERGRWVNGERQHLAKLTEDAVRTIRQERAKDPPTPLEELAARFSVSLVAVSWAATGKTWKHIEGAIPSKRRELSKEDVRAIRAARSETPPATHQELADRFDVATVTISRIVRGLRH